jgi:hypothetical protein
MSIISMDSHHPTKNNSLFWSTFGEFIPNYLTEIYSIFQFKNKFKYYLRNIATN